MSWRYFLETLLLLLVGLTATLLAYLSGIDERLAHGFAYNLQRMAPLGHGLTSAILISAETAVITALAGFRVVCGKLPTWGKVVLVACTASVLTFAVNDFALKILFGMPNPGQFLFAGASHRFNFFQGDMNSSFPSGHMALAASFSAVIMRLYPTATIIFVTLLVAAGAILVLGDWHFLSDVISGGFIGIISGLAAGELWLQHAKHYSL